MFFCHSSDCNNPVDEEFTWCDSCKSKHYRKAPSTEELLARVQSLAETAPPPRPQTTMPQPSLKPVKAFQSSAGRCHHCDKKKHVLYLITGTSCRICTSCIEMFKFAFGSLWEERVEKSCTIAQEHRALQKKLRLAKRKIKKSES